MFRRFKLLLSRILGIFAGNSVDRDFDEEVNQHLALLAEDFERRGLSPEQAKYAARKQFGAVTQLKERRRDSLTITLLEDLRRDFQLALRTIRKSPAFSVTVVLTLGIGIGANSAMFTLTEQMLLRVLPVKTPQRLVLLNDKGEFIGGSCRPCKNTFSYPAYVELRDSNPKALTGLAARYQAVVDVAVNGSAQRAQAELVSGNYFEVLGVSAAVGRTLTPQDDRLKSAEPYVVLSYSYWQSRFGGNPGVLNRTIDVNGHPMTIVGIAPRGFLGFDEISPSDLFVPMMMKAIVTPTWDDLEQRNSTWLRIFGRLEDGASPKSAEAALAVPFKAVLRDDLATVHRDEEFSKEYLQSRLVLTSATKGFNNLADTFGKPIYVLSIMVGLLLLIACVNVANLLLSRASTRQKEMAVRLALGASRGSLLRLAFAESFTLATLGGVTGLGLAYYISGLLIAVLPIENSQSLISAVPDLKVLCFTAALTILTSLLFGLSPALQATRPDMAPTLKNESASLSLGRGQIGVRRSLVFLQVTLSVLLLVGAGLFTRSLQKLMSVNVGIKETNLLSFVLTPSRHRYTAQQAGQYYLDLQDRLGLLPGVTSVSAAFVPILSGESESATVHVESYQPKSGEDMNVTFNAVLPEFFATMGVPLIAGKDFSRQSTVGSPKVVIVNEAFAKRYAHNGNAVGLHLGWYGHGPMDYQIIGVMKDMKQIDLREQVRPAAYISVLQYPASALPDLTFYLRTTHNPLAASESIQKTVARVDPSIPVSNLKTLQMQIDETHDIDRLFAWVSEAFAAIATILAAIGLYGLTAFLATRRRLEIGIRLALGAERNQVLTLMMKEVLLLGLLGVSCGLLLAALLARFIQSQLYGIKATDPTVMVLASMCVVVVCGAAAYLPASRAVNMDPTNMLRCE